MSGDGRRGPGPGSRAGVASAHTLPTTPARLTQAMTVMIHRVVAGYAVVNLGPALPQLVMQVPGTARPWLLSTCLGYVVAAVGMLVRAVAARPLGAWAGVFAAVTFVALVTLPFGSSTLPPDMQPWLFWELGIAIVCLAMWLGFRPAVVYGVMIGVAWTVLRTSAGGGYQPVRLAVCEAIFAVSSALVITVVALGMRASAAVADELAARLYARQLREAVERAVADERARLDQLIHDDVMTTLTSAAYARDTETGVATALLARDTLQKVDALPSTGGREGSLSLAVLGNIAGQTARRVSPDVGYTETIGADDTALRVPMEVAETLLGALREAVRNAVRHARAQSVRVALRGERIGSDLALDVEVVDDGRGFDPAVVPANRLGIRVSMIEASNQVGVVTELTSEADHGTTFTMRWTGAPRPAPDRAVRSRTQSTEAAEDRLPVAFPVRQFAAVVWLSYAVGVGTGLANLDQLGAPGPVVLAMLSVGAATAVVLRPGRTLRLPASSAWAVLGLLTAAMLAMNVSLPANAWPDLGLWHLFPTQLLLVCLVIRLRRGCALAGLVVVELCLAWWSMHSIFGLAGVFRAGSSHVLFVVIALLVNRLLRSISRRQAALRRQEDEAIDESVRRHVALVQRSLWVADLRTQARAILVRLADVSGPVPPALRYDALLVEATLRESLVARNVMSDELAELTENARRRGVDVRFVDSRQSVVPLEVSQALLDAIRRALAPDTVTRLVVRLAPDDGVSKATVLAEDATGTHLVSLDRDGVGQAREVQAHEP